MEAIQPQIQRLSFPINGFGGLETGSVSVPMPSLNKSMRNRLGVSRSVPCTPGRNRITERGRSECERDPRTNLTVGRLPQQNISTGAPFWQNTQKKPGRGVRGGVGWGGVGGVGRGGGQRKEVARRRGGRTEVRGRRERGEEKKEDSWGEGEVFLLTAILWLLLQLKWYNVHLRVQGS